MFDVVLVNPEIPPNTGNIIRLCANTGTRLHLVEPLGFSVTDRQLKRAGLDYHELAWMTTHPSWDACVAALAGRRIFATSRNGSRRYDEAAFRPGDAFVFGPETRGLPAEILESFPVSRRLFMPMLPGNRSLNLSNAVAIVVFEAWRQNAFDGAQDARRSG